MTAFLFFVVCVCYSSLGVVSGEVKKQQVDKEGRMFPLFNIVSFKNDPCASSAVISGSQRRNGTCLTSTECSSKGGTASGNCAASFGVCCLFLFSGSSGTITQNCSYIQNTGFPSALADTTAASFTVQKCSASVCDLRLDFETFSIVGTGNTLETTGGVCTDTFVVTVQSGQTVPTICGSNSGEHIYVSLGNQASDTATLAFTFAGSSTIRMFDIKVTQVECNSQLNAPDTCLQYYVGTTGRIQTFNFAPTSGETHLQNQRYTACIRQEVGFCCILYQVCPDTTNPFTTSATNGAVTSLIDSQCTEDFVTIDGGMATCTQTSNPTVTTRFCGTNFHTLTGQTTNIPVCDCSAPFVVGINFDNTDDQADAGNTVNTRSRGVCLDYMQVACNG